MLSLVALCAVLLAPAEGDASPAASTQVERASPRFDRVLHDVAENGNLFARGPNWKMEFSSNGARYFPRLGPKAERNRELKLSPRNAQPIAPVREGDRVVFARGEYDEIYDLSPASVEQSFRFTKRPQQSSIALAVGQDLTLVSATSAELRFEVPGLAAVVVNEAVGIDANGKRTPLALEYVNGDILIHLADSWLATARYPILVDPLIKTITIDSGADADKNSDVAYAPSVKVFQVVHEQVISAADSDVVATRYDQNGNFLDVVSIDISLEDSEEPSVAQGGSHFMTAWTDHDSGVFGDRIRVRGRVAGSTALNTTFAVSPSTDLHESSPSIGGGDAAGRFLVTWDGLGLGDSDSNVRGRIVTVSGTAGGGFGIHGFSSLNPRVSKNCGTAGRWLVAFEDYQSVFYSGNDYIDVRVALVDTSGNVGNNKPVISAGGPEVLDYQPAVDGDGTNFFVVFERLNATTSIDIMGRAITASNGVSGITQGTLFNLSVLELGASNPSVQVGPSLAFDGLRYTLTYAEPSLLCASTFQLTPTPAFQQSHVILDQDAASHEHPRIAAAPNLIGRSFVTWTQTNVQVEEFDVLGALYTNLSPGGVSIQQTGCGGQGFEPLVFSGSVPALGQTCSVLLVGFHSPLVALGPPVLATACPNTGCQFGVATTTYLPFTDPSGIFTFTIPTTPSLLGTQLAFQGLDFLIPSGTPTFCTNGVGQKFTTSDTLVFTVQ